MKLHVLLICAAAFLVHAAAFSNYLGRHQQWQALKAKLDAYKDASKAYTSGKNTINDNNEDIDRIWFKRTPGWRDWSSSGHDRIWLKRRSGSSSKSVDRAERFDRERERDYEANAQKIDEPTRHSVMNHDESSSRKGWNWNVRDRIWLKRRSGDTNRHRERDHEENLNAIGHPTKHSIKNHDVEALFSSALHKIPVDEDEDSSFSAEISKRVSSLSANNAMDGASFLRIKEDVADLLRIAAKVEKDDLNDVNDDEEEEEEDEGESGGFRYDVTLDSKGKLHLYWDIDPITETVSFRLVAKMVRSDMLAFGLSDYGEAENADFVVVWTDEFGKHMFQDAHTDASGLLHVDQSQDYTLDDVTLMPDSLTLTFHRAYDTCDDDDYLIDTGTTHLLFFTGAGLSRSIDGINVTEHRVGMQRVQLLKSQLPDPAFPEDTKTFVMNVENVPVPPAETTYWCFVRKLPPLPRKHHVVRFEGAISPDSVGIVHHMEVFHCEVPVGSKLRDYDAPCHDKSERPMGLEACRKVIGAWAMGADGLTYPAEAGYPIGGEGVSSYVMMEVHYNNPTHKTGIIDSSGIRFFVTEQLRQYDAGTMELGMEYTDKYAIPPNQDRFKLHGYCIPDCTRTALPENGITVFGSQLHTHLTGKQVYTKHYRDGIALPDLNRDNHYSPHYQSIRQLQRPVTVLPGDSLVTTCVDSTAGNNNVVMGGFAISDEMCVNYIHYYPKVDLEVCKSSVTTSSLYGFFNFLHEYQHEQTSPTMGIVDNFKSVDWSPLNVQLLKTFMDTSPLSMQCNKSDGTRFPGNWENKPIPTILHESPPEERPCLT